MFNLKYREHTELFFSEYRLLNVNQLYIYEICLFMYKYCNKCLPDLFNNMFNVMHNVHKYQTRNKFKLVIPYCRTDLRKRTIIYNGAFYYNNLIMDICSLSSIATFKKTVRSLIIEKHCKM